MGLPLPFPPQLPLPDLPQALLPQLPPDSPPVVPPLPPPDPEVGQDHLDHQDPAVAPVDQGVA